MSKAIWMKVTKDEYELPLVIADTASELERKLGLAEGTIRSVVYKAKKRGSKTQYVKVEMEDEVI